MHFWCEGTFFEVRRCSFAVRGCMSSMRRNHFWCEGINTLLTWRKTLDKRRNASVWGNKYYFDVRGHFFSDLLRGRTQCEGITFDVKRHARCEGTHYWQGHGDPPEHGKWRSPPCRELQPLPQRCHSRRSRRGQSQPAPGAMAGRPCRKRPPRVGPGWAAAPRSPPRWCCCSAALGRPPSPHPHPPHPAPHSGAAAGAASALAAPTACETPVSAALPQPPQPALPLSRHRCPTLCKSRGDAGLCLPLSSAETSGSGRVLSIGNVLNIGNVINIGHVLNRGHVLRRLCLSWPYRPP